MSTWAERCSPPTSWCGPTMETASVGSTLAQLPWRSVNQLGPWTHMLKYFTTVQWSWIHLAQNAAQRSHIFDYHRVNTLSVAHSWTCNAQKNTLIWQASTAELACGIEMYPCVVQGCHVLSHPLVCVCTLLFLPGWPDEVWWEEVQWNDERWLQLCSPVSRHNNTTIHSQGL